MSIIDRITINTHSSIRIAAEKVMYFDPFQLKEEKHDADLIFFTHSHFDHFSPEDFIKAANENTVFVCPESMHKEAENAGIPVEKTVYLRPGSYSKIEGIEVEAIAAYNLTKQFHPKKNGWVGYVVSAGGERVYVCGDTDATPEAERVKCDVALIPVGGTYTMNAEQAAGLANKIHPKTAVPTHYGSVAGTSEDGRYFIKAVKKDIRTEIKISDR